MNFHDIVIECIRTPALVSEFNRLTGSKLGIDTRAPIEKMIDKATGYKDYETEDIREFVSFVFECIWIPLADGEVESDTN